jgi:polyphosphate kinase
VGRFLEHSRIYYFQNAGREQVYLGSADLMGRNLHHRVELLVPVENKRLLKRLREDILETYLKDNRNARHMQSDGTFVWDKSGEPAVDSQAQFLVAPVARAEVRKKKSK